MCFAEKVLAGGADPSYESVLGYLSPIKHYTFVGTAASGKKYIVMPDGTIRSQPEQKWRKVKVMDTCFDPNSVVPKINPTAAKLGRLGHGLPATDFGFFDTDSAKGFEQIVFAVPDKGKAKVYVRIRTHDGSFNYLQLEPLQKLSNPKQFYRDLLELHEKWSRFFQQGMQLNIPEQRVIDVCQGSIALAISSSIGLHPKYGMGKYWAGKHDSFPPTTVALCRCLLDWGLRDQAKARLGYYLTHFVKDDGSFDYYGPAVSEYGQMLEMAALCASHTKDWAWFDKHLPALERITDRLLTLRAQSLQANPPGTLFHGLISGSAEADTRQELNYYFSGDTWAWRGLLELAKLYGQLANQRGDEALRLRSSKLLKECDAYRADILNAAKKSVIYDTTPPFLPPIVGFKYPFERMTQERKHPGQHQGPRSLASYTNYRYWLEALSAQCLGEPYEQMMIDYRRTHGGELLGMTRFAAHLDDWPIFNYAYSLIARDDVRGFLLTYYGHMAHHRTRGTFTAYEQMHFTGSPFRDIPIAGRYCVPAQLIIPLMTRWMLVFEERDQDVLWLCKAVPRRWFKTNFGAQNASTRWGPVSFNITPNPDLSQFVTEVNFADTTPAKLCIRLRHPENKQLLSCKTLKGTCVSAICRGDYVEIKQPSRKFTTLLTFAQ